MRIPFLLVVVCAALGYGAASCQGSVAEEDFLPTLAEDLCNLQQECECEGALSGDQCVTFVEQGLGMFLVPPASAGLSYDAACAGEVVDAYRSLGCDSLEVFVDVYADEQECRLCKVFHGTKTVGQACTRLEDSIFDDCGPDLLCLDDVCGDPCEVAGEGESCEGRRCDEDLVCTLSIETGDTTCLPSAKLGESCDGVSCADDLVCDSETQTCAPPPGVGEPCFGSCDSDSWCDTSDSDSANWVCREPKDDGEACMSGRECSSDDCDFDTHICVEQGPLVCSLQG